VGIGVCWSIPWALTGLVAVAASIYLFAPLPRAVLPGIAIRMGLDQAPNWGFLGFVTGGLFSVALGIAGRRTTLRELSMRRFVLWGALAGAVPPITLIAASPTEGSVPIAAFLLAISVALGAGCAAASLRLARLGAGRGGD
jgi:hypothetical protein